MICWTLGITEHHNAVDNVLALINLVAADRARRAVRQRRQPAPWPEQRPGRRRHGRPARPAARLPARRERRAPREVRRGLGRDGPAASAAGTCRRCSTRWSAASSRRSTCIGENPVQSEADQTRARCTCSRACDFLVVQDIFLTATAELADVVLPAARGLGRERGHGHELRAARPARPQGARPAGRGPRRPRGSSTSSPAGWATTGATDGRGRLERGPRALAGPRRDELRAARGARRPPVAVLRRDPPRRAVPPQPALGGPVARQPRAVRRRSSTIRRSTSSTDDFPIRLTTGRRLDSYNTGVQTGGYTSPLRRGESLDISPEDAEAYGLADGERVRVVSRRGQVEVPVRIDPSLRPGPHVHDAPLPGRRRDEPADDRRDRPEVRHRRVQGDRDPDREARGGRPGLTPPARRARGARDAVAGPVDRVTRRNHSAHHCPIRR